MTNVKLLIADVDGTLVTNEKILTTRARDAVEKLRQAGIAFAVTSGRPPRGMAMLVEPLALTTPVAAFNGGLMVTPDLATVLVQRNLPRAASLEAVDRLLGAGVDVWVYKGTGWFVRRSDAPHVARERATVQFDPTLTDDLHSLLDDAVKIVGVSDNLPLIARCEVELRRRLDGHVSASRSQPYYLDVTHPDANKGKVVLELSNRLGIASQQIAVIGDMPNDVLMFGLASVSIAMGNSSLEVQRCARYVTASNANEGFAEGVDRFVLGLDERQAPAASP